MTDRHGIGGNSPPPHEAFALTIDDLISLLSASISGGPVSNDDQEAAIDGILDDLRTAAKDADKARAAEKKPHDDAAKAVQAKWKPIIDKAINGADAAKNALTPYRTAKQRAAEEAARQARAEAEAKARAAQEALRASEELEDRLAAEEALKQAEKQTKAANRIERAPTGLRTYWTAEITDKKAALIAFIARNPAAFEELIQRLADQEARGTRPEIPGIIYHEQKKAA